MDLELNKKIVEKIISNIERNNKPVSYLASCLKISNESAYRRLRGDIPFTIQELVFLAIDLNFSVDDIIFREKQNQTLFNYTGTEKDSEDFFFIMLKKYGELNEKLGSEKNVGSIMAFNTFPPPFFYGFNNLFKFSYNKWLYQEKEISRNWFNPESVLPEDAFFFKKNLAANIIQGTKASIIFDLNIFHNLIKEIQYFYHIRLITNEELFLLKDNVLQLIERFEKISQKGFLGSTNVQLYLSSLYVSSNTMIYEYDNSLAQIFWVFSTNPVLIHNADFNSLLIKWLNAIKRQSELITQSNEILQMEFFSKQREYVDRYLSVEN